MGQDWNLTNVDKLTSFKSWGKMGEFFWEEQQNFIDRLTAPVNPAEWPHLVLNKDKRSAAVAQTATLLTKLPIELLLAIAKELLEENFLDLLWFAMTCVKIWEVTEDIRFEYLRSRLQERSWAGSRIICLGNYAEDLPQGLLSEEDVRKLQEMEEDDEDKDEAENEDNAELSLLNRSLTRYPLAFDWFGRECDALIPDARYLLGGDYWCAGPLGKAWLSLNLVNFTLRHAPSTPRMDRWMLRNLTKKEFVIRSKEGTSGGLLQVLLSLISWSNDSSISMVCDEADAEKLIRGPWAGDRIDVTLYSLHEQEKNSDWKNVTDEVLKLVERLAEKDVGAKDDFLETLPF
ncbi:hypothetical protein BDP27DRAFT_1318332 [Rhodocollybia butyracea]|uniref:Uncharacterized protein n=1 Tax=Rhodocollybia butyracea TaxID=206335 RepID=A0A9P5UBA2_9AGAR|nr:hypothetical protein BDP27DRAFT_1318332 [Rhodocollybia butyracea]